MHFLPALDHLGMWGYWLVFFFAFFEAIAFIGTFIPGATAVVIAGVLASQGFFDVGDLIWFASFGAIAGDFFSYWLGTKGTRYFRDENRFLKISHIERGKRFFKKHGNKSIFLGRFIGPIRAIVPFIAGLSHMDRMKFLVWNIISGCAWASSHVLLGYLFGDTYTGVATLSKRAGVILAVATLSIMFIWLLMKNTRKMLEYARALAEASWRMLMTIPAMNRFEKAHPGILRFFRARFDHTRFFGAPLSLGAGAVVLIASEYFGFVGYLIKMPAVVAFDMRTETILYAFRDPALARLFLWITFLGNGVITVALAAGTVAFFVLWRLRAEAASFLVTILGTELSVGIGKMFVHRARPGGLIPYYTEQSFAFPSEHAAISIALFGFLAYAIGKNMHVFSRSHRVPFSLGLGAFIVSFSIAFSRLYLGVHYPSDVLGGYFTGLLWLGIGMAVCRWLSIRSSSIVLSTRLVRIFQGITAGIFLAEAVFFIQFANTDKATFSIGITPAPTTFASPIAGALSQDVFPEFAENVFSEAEYPITFVIESPDDQTIKAAFEAAHWREASQLTFESLMAAIRLRIARQPNHTRPVMPALWFGASNDMAFVRRYTARKDPVHFARVWRTSFLAPDGNRIYVVEVGSGTRTGLVFTDAPDADFSAERELLYADFRENGIAKESAMAGFSQVLEEATFGSDAHRTDGRAYIIILEHA